ncbi:MAG: metallophosphoesterase family protein [Pikeienuella sp.]
MTGYSIAHLTDAHLPLHGGFHARELCGKRALSAANWLRRRRRLHLREIADRLRADVLAHAPDHVAMTGDAVNFGLAREFPLAAEWLGGFGPADRVSFTPGNHEALTGGWRRPCEAAFGPFITGDDGAAGWPWLRRRGPVALIGLSSAIPTPPFFAQGEVGPAQVERLRAHLAATRGACRIVLIHHPPTEMSKPRKALRDRAATAAAIAAEGAELVLHGHNHRNEMSWIDGRDGRVPVLGAPSASCPAGTGHAPAEWRLLTIREEGEGWRVEILRRALGDDGAFVDRGRFSLPAQPAPAAG